MTLGGHVVASMSGCCTQILIGIQDVCEFEGKLVQEYYSLTNVMSFLLSLRQVTSVGCP